MVGKMVTVELDKATLSGLKRINYSLCFAKKVNDQYNVVWKVNKRYLARNTLSWTPEFEVFGTNVYREAITVQEDTNVVKIQLGEKCTLDEDGNLGEAVSGTHQNSVTILNEYGPIHFGLSQVCEMNGEKTCIPVYVLREARAKGEIVLTPKENIIIWFQPDVETSTIFEEPRSYALEIDLNDTNSRTVSFDFETGNWRVLK